MKKIVIILVWVAGAAILAAPFAVFFKDYMDRMKGQYKDPAPIEVKVTASQNLYDLEQFRKRVTGEEAKAIIDRKIELLQNSNGTLKDKSAQQVKKLVDSWGEGSLGLLLYNAPKEYFKPFSAGIFYEIFGQPDKKQFLSSRLEPDSYYFLYNCKDGVVQIKVHAEQLDDNGIVLIQDLNIF